MSLPLRIYIVFCSNRSPFVICSCLPLSANLQNPTSEVLAALLVDIITSVHQCSLKSDRIAFTWSVLWIHFQTDSDQTIHVAEKSRVY